MAGLLSLHDHATAQRFVLLPCSNSVTAKLVMPCLISISTSALILLNLPSMDVYHWTRSRSWRLSSIIRFTKATSPPLVTISTSAPVQVFK